MKIGAGINERIVKVCAVSLHQKFPHKLWSLPADANPRQGASVGKHRSMEFAFNPFCTTAIAR